uniref:Si:dkey-208m12.3 n=1 Tax=Cyprinus carpio TaxID=7962 RepID=A0A8C2I449_CYPCA
MGEKFFSVFASELQCYEQGFILFSCFIHCNNMKILQLQLYALICCQYAVSDLLTDLGSNVIINCDLDENDVYWILLKTSDPPTVILRSLSTQTPPFYPNKSFRKKYSVQFKHRLVINNVTADELGVYYCMNTETPPKLSNSTRIYFNESAQLTECHNHTVYEFIDQNQTQYQIIIIISALMNGLLLILLIGLLKVFVFGNRRSTDRSQHFNADLQPTQVAEQHQDPQQLQYAEVDFSKFRRNIRSSQINSTYAALKLPKHVY